MGKAVKSKLRKGRVYCAHCKYYSIDVLGGSDWFLFFDCRSPKNNFMEHDSADEYEVHKKPEELNKNNNCKFYEKASADAIENSKGHFRGPWQYYESKGGEK